ncbi:ABC transporter permease [Haladaptatus litoreus]|uniref:ABC transporter permease n=1 Tax=Haladaptatus litoreus TaxID=553468 RepID=UPI001FEC95C0|nr:ABC transporter permease [Haladaptatus litoreus]
MAIVVIAVTVAFLTGTTLVIAAASAQTTAIAQEYDTEGTAVYHESVVTAREQAGKSSLVIPLAEVTLPNGETQYVAGISRQRAQTFNRRIDGSIPNPPPSGVSSGTMKPRAIRLSGQQTQVTVNVTSRSSTHQFIPSEWFIAQPELVEQLGSTGAFVITPASEQATASPDRGVPLRSALSFFILGTRQLLTVLTVTAIGGAILVGVTVYSVTKMTVRDRLQAIRVLRSTGCHPFSILQLFALRAGLLTGVGIGIGYTIGVILPNIAVNVAVFAGLPTSLTLRVSQLVLSVLLPVYGGTMLVGLCAGVVAAWPTISGPPSQLSSSFGRKRPASAVNKNVVRRILSLRLLDWRALGPSTATLTVFVTVVLLVTSVGGVLMPLMTAEGTTITEPGAIHPVASKVPEQYADGLHAQGIPASAEILLFTVHDGKPIVARGANYSDFANISNATIEQGQRPTASNEALIGTDLAQTTGIKVGDRVTLGGSTESGIARIHIVGTYSASGPYDDQLLLSLPTAQHLSTTNDNTVHIIRTPKQFDRTQSSTDIEILDVRAPSQATANASVPVEIQVRNFGSAPTTRNISVWLGNVSQSVPVTLPAHSQQTKTIRLRPSQPGSTTLQVGNYTQPLAIKSANAIQVDGLPAQVPPNSEPQLIVSTVDGDPIPNATVRVANTTVRTGSNGAVRVPFDSAGSHTLHVETQNQHFTKTVEVTPSARRMLTGDVQIQPPNPSLLSQPEAHVHLYNPWNTTLDRTIRLSGDVERTTRSVSVAAGDNTTEVYHLGEQPPGAYSVSVTADNHQLATASYSVSGDDRLVAAYASSGRADGSTGIAQALNTAFGNMQVLLVVLIMLAGMMTVGSTTAVFAQAVHARQQAVGVYRATGASPIRVLRVIITDALTVGLVAIGCALICGIAGLALLSTLDFLIIYGVRITPTISPTVFVGSLIGGLGIVLVSAIVVAGSLIIRQPSALVRKGSQTNRNHTMLSDGGSDE